MRLIWFNVSAIKQVFSEQVGIVQIYFGFTTPFLTLYFTPCSSVSIVNFEQVNAD